MSDQSSKVVVALWCERWRLLFGVRWMQTCCLSGRHPQVVLFDKGCRLPLHVCFALEPSGVCDQSNKLAAALRCEEYANCIPCLAGTRSRCCLPTKAAAFLFALHWSRQRSPANRASVAALWFEEDASCLPVWLALGGVCRHERLPPSFLLCTPLARVVVGLVRERRRRRERPAIHATRRAGGHSLGADEPGREQPGKVAHPDKRRACSHPCLACIAMPRLIRTAMMRPNRRTEGGRGGRATARLQARGRSGRDDVDTQQLQRRAPAPDIMAGCVWTLQLCAR